MRSLLMKSYMYLTNKSIFQKSVKLYWINKKRLSTAIGSFDLDPSLRPPPNWLDNSISYMPVLTDSFHPFDRSYMRVLQGAFCAQLETGSDDRISLGIAKEILDNLKEFCPKYEFTIGFFWLYLGESTFGGVKGILGEHCVSSAREIFEVTYGVDHFNYKVRLAALEKSLAPVMPENSIFMSGSQFMATNVSGAKMNSFSVCDEDGKEKYSGIHMNF